MPPLGSLDLERAEEGHCTLELVENVVGRRRDGVVEGGSAKDRAFGVLRGVGDGGKEARVSWARGTGTNDDLTRRDLNWSVARKGFEGDGVVWCGKVVEPLSSWSGDKKVRSARVGRDETDLDGESERSDSGGQSVPAENCRGDGGKARSVGPVEREEDRSEIAGFGRRRVPLGRVVLHQRLAFTTSERTPNSRCGAR